MTATETSLPINLAELQLDPVAERFFSQAQHALDEVEPPKAAMSPTERRAMRATFAMLAASAVALAGFLVYSRVMMPQPVKLGGEHGVVTAQLSRH
jgi:hypothetical protein